MKREERKGKTLPYRRMPAKNEDGMIELENHHCEVSKSGKD